MQLPLNSQRCPITRVEELASDSREFRLQSPMCRRLQVSNFSPVSLPAKLHPTCLRCLGKQKPLQMPTKQMAVFGCMVTDSTGFQLHCRCRSQG
jgi:hypothetical protein